MKICYVFSCLIVLVSFLISVRAEPSNSLELDDCAICLEPLDRIYPKYYHCQHNQFHTKCIYSSPDQLKILRDAPDFINHILPSVQVCPLCRAESILWMSAAEHNVSMNQLKYGMFLKFSNFLTGKFTTDAQVAAYAIILVTKSRTDAMYVLSKLHVRDWYIILPIFKKAIIDENSNTDLLIKLGSPSPAHSEYDIL